MGKNAGDFITAPGEALSQVFTTDGTWNKPNGVRAVRVRVVGGGGGSGGCTGAGTGNAASGGGGAGGYTEMWLTADELGATESVTVGAGGTPGSPSTSGGTGNSSAFGAHCSATGGTGGGASTATTGSAQAAGGNGGVGSGGDVNIAGGDGPLGMVVAGVAVRNSMSASTMLGMPKRMSVTAGTAPNGNNFGGGAPSAWASTGNANGGTGGSGIVIVESIF